MTHNICSHRFFNIYCYFLPCLSFDYVSQVSIFLVMRVCQDGLP